MRLWSGFSRLAVGDDSVHDACRPRCVLRLVWKTQWAVCTPTGLEDTMGGVYSGWSGRHNGPCVLRLVWKRQWAHLWVSTEMGTCLLPPAKCTSARKRRGAMLSDCSSSLGPLADAAAASMRASCRACEPWMLAAPP